MNTSERTIKQQLDSIENSTTMLDSKCAECGRRITVKDAEHVGILDPTQECGWIASTADGEPAFLCPDCYQPE